MKAICWRQRTDMRLLGEVKNKRVVEYRRVHIIMFIIRQDLTKKGSAHDDKGRAAAESA